MGKENVQNLISFYLNANMYQQFAVKELSQASNKNDVKEVKLALKDFAKGLINSYLLSAANFVSNENDEVRYGRLYDQFEFYLKKLYIFSLIKKGRSTGECNKSSIL